MQLGNKQSVVGGLQRIRLRVLLCAIRTRPVVRGHVSAIAAVDHNSIAVREARYHRGAGLVIDRRTHLDSRLRF
jgi:hypothetical protein